MDLVRITGDMERRYGNKTAPWQMECISDIAPINLPELISNSTLQHSEQIRS